MFDFAKIGLTILTSLGVQDFVNHSEIPPVEVVNQLPSSIIPLIITSLTAIIIQLGTKWIQTRAEKKSEIKKAKAIQDDYKERAGL